MTNFERLQNLPIAQFTSVLESFIDELNEEQLNENVVNYINAMSSRKIIESYLNYEGIYGYTDSIINLVQLFDDRKDY